MRYDPIRVVRVQRVNNLNQLNMFRAIISPIFRSTRLCLQLVVYSTDDDASSWPGGGGTC